MIFKNSALNPERSAMYRKEWLRPDIIAGLTTAAVVIPKAMAYAAIAGLPLEIGLYTALIPLVVYAVSGTSRPLSVTTTTAIAILTGSELLRVVPDGDNARLMAAAATLAFLVGIFMIVAEALKLGFLSDFISDPVLAGFKTGIAVVIIIDQIPKLLGIHIAKGTFFHNALSIGRHLTESSVPTVLFGIALLVIIFSLERYTPRIPAPLVAIVFAVAAVWFAGLDRLGIELVGGIRSGLPSFALPDISLVKTLWPGALGVALMSFVESAAAGRAFIGIGEKRPVPNRELLALGLANLIGGFFRTMPAGGGTSQTAVNRAAGARSKAAGLITAIAVAAVLLFLAPLVRYIPQAALAAVVVATTIGLIKPAEFRAIRRIRTMEFRWAIFSLTGVVLIGTLEGILIAVSLSILAILFHANQPPVYALGRKPGTRVFRELSPEHPGDETIPGLLLLRTEGRMHFGNMQYVGDRLWPIVHKSKPRVLVLDCSAIPDFEYTAIKALGSFEARLREEGVLLWLASLNPGALKVLERSPVGKFLGKERLFYNIEQAVQEYCKIDENRKQQSS
jgi:SulP family sulfate permease